AARNLFPSLANNCQSRLRSVSGKTRFSPSRPRFFKQRGTLRRLFEVQGGPIGAPHSQQGSREVQVQLETLDPDVNQPFERPRRGGIVVAIQCEKTGAHAFVSSPEFQDLVFRISA